MKDDRFLIDSDYYEIITKEALNQIMQPGNEYKFRQAEESAEMSILEYLVENYEIEKELMLGKMIREYDSRINYPINVHILYEDNIYKVIRSISGRKAPSDTEYWKEYAEIIDITTIESYSQLKTYKPGDLVAMNDTVYECVNENGYEFNDIRIPMVDGWVRDEVEEWIPTPYELQCPVSYKGKYYQLYKMDEYDETVAPDLLPQCWGEVLPYDPTYNEYEISPNELVVYNGNVYHPIIDVNSDEPLVGTNLVLDDPRNKNIRKHMVRLALYELTKNIAPNNVSTVRQADFEMSMQWLSDANRLKINPMIPRKVGDDKKPLLDWGIATFQKDYDPYCNPWQI